MFAGKEFLETSCIIVQTDLQYRETNKLLMSFFFTQLKFFFSCNVVTIITMTTCNIIIGTVAITHFQYESTVGIAYMNQNNQDYFKAEEDFKARIKHLVVFVCLFVCLFF